MAVLQHPSGLVQGFVNAGAEDALVHAVSPEVVLRILSGGDFHRRSRDSQSRSLLFGITRKYRIGITRRYRIGNFEIRTTFFELRMRIVLTMYC